MNQSRYVITDRCFSQGEFSGLQLHCQKWSLSGRKPRLLTSQTLEAGETSWRLYDQPATKAFSQPNGRPLPVSSTTDLRCIRVGSKLFCQLEVGTYSPVELPGGPETYFEQIAQQDSYVALSCRQPLTEDDLVEKKEASSAEKSEFYDFSEDLRRRLEESLKANSEAETSKATTNSGDTQTSEGSASSSRTSISPVSNDSSGNIPKLSEEHGALPAGDSEVDIMSQDSEEEDDISAATSYSEASTPELSGEEEEESHWNDWEDDIFAVSENHARSDLSLVLKADTHDRDESSDLKTEDITNSLSENSVGSAEYGEIHVGLFGQLDLASVSTTPTNSSAPSVQSHYSPSFAASSENPDDDSDDEGFENGGGQHLEDLLLGHSSQGKSSTRVSKPTLRVFDTKMGEEKAIFHFAKKIKNTIFASPPAFHPFKPLLIWPIGDQEILFANIANNTYFTRQLCCSHRRSCHVSINSHFTKDGKYLHFAALEARQIEEFDVKRKGRTKSKGCLDLALQVSTHRLSSRKTERCPPRLCFRTTVALDRRAKLYVADQPYTLTWTANDLYVASGKRTLSVIKIPLFRKTHSSLTTQQQTNTSVCYSQGAVYLPRMDQFRSVQYFPPRKPQEITETSATTSSAKPRRSKHHTNDDKATLVISSHCSVPAHDYFVPRSLISPPIVVYLDEEKDLGPWTCEPPSTDKMAGAAKADQISPLAGRLKSRFETFDRNKDCDIVPFLV